MEPAAALAKWLHKNVQLDIANDLLPIAMIATAPPVLFSHTSVAANNAKELIAYSKTNPGKLSVGTAGVGTPLHLAALMFNAAGRAGRCGCSRVLSHCLASVAARILAGLIDLLVLGAIDAGVLYSTLRLLSLPLAGIVSLPPVPLGVFLLLLNGGYLTIFTTAGGQTMGKMIAGIRVVADPPTAGIRADYLEGGVTMGASVLRASAYLASLLPMGLGFAAILFDSDGRALHDRLAETRVVKA